MSKSPSIVGLATFMGTIAFCTPALAQNSSAPASTTESATDRRLDELSAQLAKTQAELDAQRKEIAQLKAKAASDLDSARGTGTGDAQTSQTVGVNPGNNSDIAEQAQAVPQGQGVLTQTGKTTLQASVTYLRAANNRLVFAGIELVPGLQIGSIQASTADRNTLIGALTVWHGLSSRLEGEIMVPAMMRTDSIQLSQVRDGTVSEGFTLHKTALGDVEGALRWQLNAPTKSDQPIFVASLRVKSNTGISPFSVAYDNFGIAKGLATGSGFWGAQPGITFLLPTDPAVIYGGISYLYQFPRNINRTVNSALIGEVRPGGALSANIGFGFALNPRFSFSLGYSHNYIFPTSTELDGTIQKSTSLQVGTLDFGMSYRLNLRQSLNFAFQFGVTQDAPNVGITVRIPTSI